MLILIWLRKLLLDLDDAPFWSSVASFVLGLVPGTSEFGYLYRVLHRMGMFAVVIAHCSFFLVQFNGASFITDAVLA